MKGLRAASTARKSQRQPDQWGRGAGRDVEKVEGHGQEEGIRSVVKEARDSSKWGLNLPRCESDVLS